jgi:hypothetical protein
MSLYISQQGRFGNNLFQYFFGYILSKKLETDFYTLFNLPVPFLPNKERHTSEFNLHVTERYMPDKIQFEIKDILVDKNIDLIVNEIKKHEFKNILVTGYFQDINYYLPYIQEIISLFKNSKQYLNIKKQIDPNGTGICIRKGDIVGTSYELSDEWYLKNAEKFKNTAIYITSDQIHHSVCQAIIKNYGAKIVDGNALQTILAFSCFKNLVLSQGTFNWWAGILCEGNVYSMLPKSGWNSDDAFINLKTPWWNWLKIEEV